MDETDISPSTTVFTRTYFWILFIIVSAVSAIFAVRYFSRAFPVVNIDLKMDRRTALNDARTIAARHHWWRTGYREAAAFNQDDQFQYYVELAAGGNEEFSRIIRSGIYSPYTWDIRHFKPGSIFETSISFTPAGKPYGLSIQIPEEQPGPALSAPAARSIAEKAATDEWQVVLSSFQLVESSQKLQPSGRADHTFVYERRADKVADARYRLRLVVTGDMLTGLSYFVKIPEAFVLHYQEIRSANDTIAAVATIAAGFFYVLGGCIITLFFLTRKRWTVVFPALQLALIVSFLQVLSDINALPLDWMSYDTAISFSGYVANQVFGTLVKFLADAALLALSFIAAESITRRAFPGHVQLWRVWEPVAASSKQVAGRTLAGYLLVAVFCAYQVGLYFVTRKALGWWSPSDSLIEPDLFATYLPWFTPFAQASHAGLWEECLFRAVPIGVAALIGQRYGKRNLCILLALLFQALLFGAAHANYPGEPAYARLVELILPSLGFGLLYIFFGLLPGILLHFAFDSTLMSIPILISSAPGVWLSKIVMFLLTLAPLGIVLYGRMKTGKWTELPAEYYNASWKPSPENEAVAVTTGVPVEGASGGKRASGIYALGVIGAVLFCLTLPLQSIVPALSISRTKAIALAKEVWKSQGTVLNAPWKGLAAPKAQPELEDTFIWRRGGAKVYRELMAKGYLEPPVWETRFALFDGEASARAEEFVVLFAGKGRQVSRLHVVPENQKGDDLSERDARAVALKAIEANYRLQSGWLKEISADSKKLPARRNWHFTFNSPADYPLKEGQARIDVRLDGSEVTGISKYIFIPEQWIRNERNTLNLKRLLSAAGTVVIVILYAAGIGVAIVAWVHKRFSISAFVTYGGIFFLLSILHNINRLPLLYERLSTAEPVVNQLLTYAGFSLLGTLFVALMIGVMNGFIQTKRTAANHAPVGHPALMGLSAGFILVGVLSAVQRFVPSLSPQWPLFDNAGAYIPAVSVCLSALVDYARQTTVYLILFVLIGSADDQTGKRNYILYALLLVVGFGIAAGGFMDSLTLWAISGLIMGNALFFGYRYIFRSHLSLLPFTVAAIVVAGILRQTIYAAFPGSLFGGLAATVLVMVTANSWHRNLEKH